LMTTPRLPDAVSLSTSIGMPSGLSKAIPLKGASWGGTYTLARDGNLYFGVDVIGDIDVRVQPLLGLSLNLTWLNQLETPTSDEMGNFFPGPSRSIYVGGIKGFGFGGTYVQGAGTSTNLGVSTPTVGITSTRSFTLGNTGVKW
jgi:hypothetical protein